MFAPIITIMVRKNAVKAINVAFVKYKLSGKILGISPPSSQRVVHAIVSKLTENLHSGEGEFGIIENVQIPFFFNPADYSSKAGL